MLKNLIGLKDHNSATMQNKIVKVQSIFRRKVFNFLQYPRNIAVIKDSIFSLDKRCFFKYLKENKLEHQKMRVF